MREAQLKGLRMPGLVYSGAKIEDKRGLQSHQERLARVQGRFNDKRGFRWNL